MGTIDQNQDRRFVCKSMQHSRLPEAALLLRCRTEGQLAANWQPLESTQKLYITRPKRAPSTFASLKESFQKCVIFSPSKYISHQKY